MKKLTIYRWVGFLEGLSFLLLLAVGVPLKYAAGNPAVVKALGMPHGILFLLWVFMSLDVASELKWSKKILGQALVASLLPAGTFVFDRRYLRNTTPQS